MDSFELNKILGAILGTLLFVMGVGFLAEGVYAPIEGRGPGYPLPEPQAAETTTAQPAAEQVAPISVRLQTADADRGQAAARKCQSCHNFAEGAGAKVGPELYGVVGRVMGSWDSFAYSDAMEQHKASGDTWTYDRLDQFITSPRDYIPGTKMTFSGDKDPQERADILAYLQTLSHDPVPFPEPEAAAAAQTPAGGAPAASQPETPPQVDNGTGAATVTQGEQPVEGTPTTSAPGTAEPAAPAETAPAQ